MIIQIDTRALAEGMGRLLASSKVRLLVGVAALGVPLAVWAAVTKPHTFTDGSTISAAQVNANFDALVTAANVPLKDRVWTANQTGSLSVTGLSWQTMAGPTLNFTLPAATTVDFTADGSVTGVAGSGYAGGHCGFRFVVDGTPYGNGTWGDRLVGCPGNGSNPPGGWWCPWSMGRSIALNSGNHSVYLQMTGWSGTSAGCSVDGGEYSNARLYVLAR